MSPANDNVYHWNTFSPRVGINYKVNDSGKTVVKAHYGRYYKALEATEFRAAVPSITTVVQVHASTRPATAINVVPVPAAQPAHRSRTSSRRTATSTSSSSSSS